MKECHVCFYVCGDEDEICPVCGAELREPAAAEEVTEEVNGQKDDAVITNPVLAARADSPVTAEIFKDILAENGIAYSVDEQGDFMHSGFGGSYFAVDIFVDEKDVDIAKEHYRNLSESDMGFEDFEDFDESDGGEL